MIFLNILFDVHSMMKNALKSKEKKNRSYWINRRENTKALAKPINYSTKVIVDRDTVCLDQSLFIEILVANDD